MKDTNQLVQTILKEPASARIHLIGIGGTGISAIARVLFERGATVTGSDMNESEYTAGLQALGVSVYIGHAAEQIGTAQLVIRSSSIPDKNPEVAAAISAGIPVVKRQDFLGYLMDGEIGIAVAGTHGKTTTTSMIGQVLLEATLDPTIIVGSILPVLGTNARNGSGDYFVIEADEYDRMFLGLRPEIGIINNIEYDHPDIYPDEESYVEAFAEFAALLPEHGRLIACIDDEGVRNLLPSLASATYEVYTIGLSKEANLRADQVRPNKLGGSDFLVMENGELIGLARLRVPGNHNVQNALAAIAVALDVGLDFRKVQEALMGFGGVSRRFQELGIVNDITVIDDYAHHPTEIKATLQAAKQQFGGATVWAVWQPHTYSRTKELFDQFVTSFDQAEKIVVLDIYRSRERDDLGMSSDLLVDAMAYDSAVHVGEIEAAAEYVLDRISRGDVLLTLGAGDGNRVGELVLAGLKKRVGGVV